MLLVYIAGPYRAPTPWGVECNVHEAKALAAEVVAAGEHLGLYPVVPHANTSHFDGLAPDDYWLAGTMAIMARCDAVLLLPRWAESAGAKAEVAEAHRIGLPVFQSLSLLAEWAMLPPSRVQKA